MKIAWVGDVHASYREFGHLLFGVKRKHNIDLVIQVGDINYFPRAMDVIDFRAVPSSLERTGLEMLWVDGNHEDHSILQYMDDFDSSSMNVFGPNAHYMKRGSLKEIAGHTFLFIGGAESRDKHNRVEGYDWFREELAWGQQINHILDQADAAVARGLPIIVVAHTCPQLAIDDPSNIFDIHDCGGTHHNKMLDEVLEITKPVMWYHGHFHKGAEYKLAGFDTRFRNLPWIRNGYEKIIKTDLKTGEKTVDFNYVDAMNIDILEL